MTVLFEIALWAVAATMFLMVTGPVFFNSIGGAAACVMIAGLMVYVVAV